VSRYDDNSLIEFLFLHDVNRHGGVDNTCYASRHDDNDPNVCNGRNSIDDNVNGNHDSNASNKESMLSSIPDNDGNTRENAIPGM
jgi:hypothetical protein